MPNWRRDQRHHPDVGTIRGTVTAMLIAFACVLIFRAAVVEAFIIPTGSMAPTLLGRHVRLHSPMTGEAWAIGSSRDRGVEDVRVTDPFTRLRVGAEGARVGSGDRVFVYKSSSFFRTPPRWSVVVFKNPENPSENYIKRLIGLPGERVWLVDGDVFVREVDGAPWRIARKPARVQDALWWTLYSSELAPRFDDSEETRWRSPWAMRDLASGQAIETDGPTFEIPGAQGATLEWDDAAHPVTDEVAYNDSPSLRGGRVFDTGDVRVRFNARAHAPGFRVSVNISARSHDFRFEALDGAARLSIRPFDGAAEGWILVDERPFTGLPEGEWTSVSFALADQSLEARVNDEVVASHDLGWSPEARLVNATGLDDDALREILENERDTSLGEPGLYRRARARVNATFDGAPATLARVGLDRDVSYAPAPRDFGRFAGEMGLAGHPLRAAILEDDQVFVLGDNSAASRDGRLWDTVDPRVAAQVGRDIGVVSLDLLVGRAFMVYFPTPHEVRFAGTRRPLVPDFGRTRMIR